MPEPRRAGQSVACSSVSSLASSIKALPSTNIVPTGLCGLESAVAKAQSDAQSATKSKCS